MNQAIEGDGLVAQAIAAVCDRALFSGLLLWNYKLEGIRGKMSMPFSIHIPMLKKEGMLEKMGAFYPGGLKYDRDPKLKIPRVPGCQDLATCLHILPEDALRGSWIRPGS